MFSSKIFTLIFLFFITHNLSNANPVHKTDWTILKVRNSGAYVARFEVKYRVNDELFNEATGTFAIGQSRSVLVPPEAVSIVIKCENNIFINSWSTVFSFNMARAETKCFDISGTTLNPRWSLVDC